MSNTYFGMGLDTATYRFIMEAYEGAGGFQTGGHLVKFARESDKKFDNRKALSYYVNHLQPACTRFVGYLAKRPVERDVTHPLVEKFIEDCDWRGNSLDIFLANFYSESKARGCSLLLVEMPKAQPQNLEQQLYTRFYPYLVALKVEDIRTFSLNAMGQLESISVQTSMMVDGRLQSVIRSWDETSWSVSLNGQIIEGSEHGLGSCPVLAFSEGYNFPSTGTFSQIAGLSKRLYNLQSELDEILRSQTFSLLTYQLPLEQQGSFDAAALSEAVGTSNMMIYSGSQAPSFASPSSGPADTILKTISELETKIKEIGLNVDLANRTESGIALTIRFQTLNAALAAFARKGEDLERRMFDMVARWLKIENTTKVSYAKSFEIADVATEMANLVQYQATGFPEEVVAAKKRQIVNLDFSNMEDVELQPLIDAIDTNTNQTSLMESRVALLEAANKPIDGNGPNANPPMDMTAMNMGGN